MAMNVNGEGGLGRRRFHGMSAMSEINVTPFVDVVLVLLIIFMMTAQVMNSDIQVDVPKTKLVRESVRDLPIVKITRDGDAERSSQHQRTRTILKSSRAVAYLLATAPCGTHARVMSEPGDAGIQVNAVTQPEDAAEKRGR